MNPNLSIENKASEDITFEVHVNMDTRTFDVTVDNVSSGAAIVKYLRACGFTGEYNEL